MRKAPKMPIKPYKSYQGLKDAMASSSPSHVHERDKNFNHKSCAVSLANQITLNGSKVTFKLTARDFHLKFRRARTFRTTVQGSKHKATKGFVTIVLT